MNTATASVAENVKAGRDEERDREREEQLLLASDDGRDRPSP